MKLVLIAVLCLVPLIEGRAVGGRETDTCIADYLKSKGLIGNGYGSNRTLNPFCEVVVEVTKGHILESVQVEVSSDKEMRGELKCVMDSLKSSDFANYLLLIYVYETNAGGEIDDATANLLKLVQAKVTRAAFDSFIKCQATKKFGEVFDAIADGEDSSQEETEASEDYCIRKHIVENNLIDSQHFQLEVNPKNLDTTTIDCNVVYRKALKDAEDELVKALLEEDSSEENEIQSTIDPTNVSCLLAVIRDGNFIDQMIHFDYVKEFNLNREARSKLRKSFIIVMTKLAENASKCFL